MELLNVWMENIRDATANGAYEWINQYTVQDVKNNLKIIKP